MIEARKYTGQPTACTPSKALRPAFEPVHTIRATLTISTCVIAPEVVRDQGDFGSCVGQSTAFAVSRPGEAASGRFLWVNARRHTNDLAGADNGTNFDAAFWVVENQGVPPYAPDENDGSPDNWDVARHGEHLGDAMAADDYRAKLKVTAIDPSSPNAFDLVCAAIMQRARVVFASGIRDPFFNLHAGAVATSAHLGGEINGHAQAFCGFDRATRELFGLNSWGAFAGLRLPKDDYPTAPAWPIDVIDDVNAWVLPGAYRIDESALHALWEIHVVEVLP